MVAPIVSPTNKMDIKVLEATEADMPRVFECCSLAFKHNEPFFDIRYPNHTSPAGRKAGADRMALTSRTDPTAIFLKACLPNGSIAGMASFHIYSPTHPGPDSAWTDHSNYWDSDPINDDTQMRRAGSFLAGFLGCRNEAIERTGGELVCLNILAVDPKYQRMGVGRKLVRWGTARADEMGVEAVVESSGPGKGLYESEGYAFQKDVEVKSSESEWRGVDGGRLAWMVRPKMSRS